MSSHPGRSSSIEEGGSGGASSSSSGGGGLHHRRVASNSLSSLKLSSSPRPPLLQHQVSYSKNKDHENGGSGGGTSSSWLYLQYHKLLLYRKKLAAQKTKMKWVPHLVILAAFMMMIMLLVTTRSSSNNNNHLVGSSILSSTSSIMRCSSFLRSLKHQSNNESPQSRLILMASHLRHGPDGEMRLRIIEHNLRLLAANEPSSTTDDHGDSSNDKQQSKSPLKAILLFSIDTQSTQSDIQTMINTWRNQISENNDKHNIATNIISQIIYVPNDTTMVDASKWIVAIDQLSPEIQSSNTRVMLINDSFVLTRPVPELWNSSICGEVCGLVWTASTNDPTRHIQSYVRTLSSCAVERYRVFYRDSSRNVHNVHELIEKFEMNLDWVDGGSGSSEGVKALYEFVGAHPDADEAQKVLIPKGYPAIKLKKFFVTDDPWLSEPELTRSRLPPSFSTSIYKRMNHDLNHLSDQDLEKHFAEDGKNEDRIYSSLPLVMKSWLREELVKMEGDGEDHDGGGESTIAILEAYLEALNRGIVNAHS